MIILQYWFLLEFMLLILILNMTSEITRSLWKQNPRQYKIIAFRNKSYIKLQRSTVIQSLK